MKVEINFTPVFNLSITKEQVNCLIWCSQRHYDNKCRMASASGSYDLQGFLTGWLNIVRSNEAYPNPEIPDPTVRMTWDEIDTCLKILEVRSFIAGTNIELYNTANELSASLLRVLQYASTLPRPNHQTEV